MNDIELQQDALRRAAEALEGAGGDARDKFAGTGQYTQDFLNGFETGVRACVESIQGFIEVLGEI